MQSVPVQPGTQAHVYLQPVAVALQVPPFLHGFASHGLESTKIVIKYDGFITVHMCTTVQFISPCRSGIKPIIKKFVLGET